MSRINGGGPAFPTVGREVDQTKLPITDAPPIYFTGMTMRDFFAATALPAILQATLEGHHQVFVAEDGSHPQTREDAIAREAFKMADAMIRAGS